MNSGEMQWLFRQGGLVLGPVVAAQIVEMLYNGTLTAQTEVRPLGDNAFRPIGEVDCFRIHLAKAQAKLRVDAVERAQKEDSRRRRNIRVGLVVLGTLVAAIGATSLAKYLAVHTPFKGDKGAFDISIEPPTITLARRSGKAEDLMEYPLDRRSVGQKLERPRPQSGRGNERPSDEPDGMKTGNFDRAGINAVVAARQRNLYSCVAEEVSKHPGMEAKIPIEFVIGNDGHVSKVWVDHSTFKEPPFQECLLKELQKWPFRPYEGERATVGLSFKVGRGS